LPWSSKRKKPVIDPLTKGYLSLRPAAAARTLSRLDNQDIKALMEAMPRQLAANVLEQMTPGTAARCLAQLTPKLGGEILARIPVPAATAALRQLQRERLKALLATLPRPTAARLRLRLRYSETVIGAYVDADVVTFTPEHRVGDALRLFRRAGQRTGQTVYVLDDRRHLVGTVDLSDLLGQRDRSLLQRAMRPVGLVLSARGAIQTVTDHPAWLTHDNLPVVDRSGLFQGVLWRAKVMEEERELLSEVAERNEQATTRAALADIFWMGVGALLIGNSDPASRDKRDEPKNRA
jgi:Mg/Co/Ni transporter MgtE